MATNGPNRGQAARMARMAAASIALLLIGGVLLLMAPVPESATPQEVAQAAPRKPVETTAWFPKYAAYLSERGNPFEPQEWSAAPPPAPVVEAMDEPAPVAPPSRPPRPDTRGLHLVGTAPGSRRAFAIFTDRRNGLTFVVAAGENLRNAVLRAVHADRVVVTLGEEETIIELPAIPGGK